MLLYKMQFYCRELHIVWCNGHLSLLSGILNDPGMFWSYLTNCIEIYIFVCLFKFNHVFVLIPAQNN